MQKLPVVLCAFTAFSVTAQTPQPASAPDNMQNAKAKLSDAASTLLNYTNLARTAIANNDRKLAKQHLDQAVQAANQLGKARRMVPVYTELNGFDVIEAIEDYQRSAASSSPDAIAWQDLARRPRPRKPRQPQPAPLEYTTIAIEAHMAATHVKAARQILRRNIEAADEALAAVQGAVVLESNSEELPLVRARRGLVSARRDASAGDIEKARADLQSACEALSQYEKQGSPHGSEAAALRAEIARFDIQAGANGVPEKMESWWTQMTAWGTPAVAAISRPDIGRSRPY